MKYLIIGSSGQIGSCLTQFLRLNEHEVIEYDIVNNEKQDARCDDVQLTALVLQSDFVFFLAFDIGGSLYIQKYQDTYQFIDNNVRMMQNVFETLEWAKKPFLFTSSEMANIHQSTYGILKTIGERYTAALNGINVQLWNMYGSKISNAKSWVIGDFIHMAKTTGQIKMRTSGIEQRQFLYVKDCCKCLYVLSQDTEKFKNKIWNIASFEWVSILQVACIIQSLIPNVKILPGKDVDQTHLNYRIEPNRDILEYWKPQISLEDGIRMMI